MKEYIEFVIPVEMGKSSQGEMNWYIDKSKGIIIRCKDCKWWHHNSTCYNENVKFGCYRKSDWFCAEGERRDA